MVDKYTQDEKLELANIILKQLHQFKMGKADVPCQGTIKVNNSDFQKNIVNNKLLWNGASKHLIDNGYVEKVVVGAIHFYHMAYVTELGEEFLSSLQG